MNAPWAEAALGIILGLATFSILLSFSIWATYHLGYGMETPERPLGIAILLLPWIGLAGVVAFFLRDNPKRWMLATFVVALILSAPVFLLIGVTVGCAVTGVCL